MDKMSGTTSLGLFDSKDFSGIVSRQLDMEFSDEVVQIPGDQTNRENLI